MYIIICGLALGLIGVIGLWIWQGFDSLVIGIGIFLFVIGLFLGLITYDYAYNISLGQGEIVSCEELIELIPISNTANEYIHIVGADELKYLYSYKTENGIQKATISIDDATIQYVSSSKKARLVKIEYSFADKLRNWLFSISYECDYTFYIPEGTIMN